MIKLQFSMAAGSLENFAQACHKLKQKTLPTLY
jgi:hypothetical protein